MEPAMLVYFVTRMYVTSDPELTDFPFTSKTLLIKEHSFNWELLADLLYVEMDVIPAFLGSIGNQRPLLDSEW